MEKNQIFIKAGADYEQMTRDLLDQADLASHIPGPQARIALKPNLVSPSPPSLGATTHPEVLAGILQYLKDHGFSRICLLESSWVGARTEEVFQVCGYQALCDRFQIPFVDAKKEKSISRNCAGMELKISSAAEKVDFLINVPVLKGHCQTKITCALKNLKGLLPDAEKRHFHSMGLHKPIAHLNAGIRQDFIVVDNICGDLDFEDGGNPISMNRVLAGRDPVLMDAYVCQLLHYEVSEVPYILLAQQLGVGCADLTKADIRLCGGEGQVSLPKRQKVVEVSDLVCEVESCSACYGSLIPALDMLREDLARKKEGKDQAAEKGSNGEELAALLGTKICIGQGWRKKTGDLGIGHCTSRFRYHLEGCPPSETDIYTFLRDYIYNDVAAKSHPRPLS